MSRRDDMSNNPLGGLLNILSSQFGPHSDLDALELATSCKVPFETFCEKVSEKRVSLERLRDNLLRAYPHRQALQVIIPQAK